MIFDEYMPNINCDYGLLGACEVGNISMLNKMIELLQSLLAGDCIVKR